VQYMAEQSDVTTPAGLPLWTILLAIPLGAALGIFHAVVQIVRPEPIPQEDEEEVELVGGGV
jgi:TRAP-type C4-dicarboxylate transport system permease small subunit